MSSHDRDLLGPESFSEAELQHLRKHRAQLLRLAGQGRGYLRVESEGETETIPLPSSLLQMLARALSEVAEGGSVSVSPIPEELSTQQAADLLNVSRPHLVKLLDEKVIPHRKVGTHRRVRRRDVLAYREKMRVEAEEALQALADQAQELGLGYE